MFSASLPVSPSAGGVVPKCQFCAPKTFTDSGVLNKLCPLPKHVRQKEYSSRGDIRYFDVADRPSGAMVLRPGSRNIPYRPRRAARRGTAWELQISLIAFLTLLSLLSGPTISEASCDDRPGPGIDWTGCTRVNRIMTGYNFHGAKLTRVNFSDSDLAGADLSGADLTNAILMRARLTGADLSRVILTKATLDRADLSGADLSSAQLVKASLTRANLSNSRLGGAISKRQISNVQSS